METAQKYFEINSLSFEAKDIDVIIRGNIIQDHMSYTTDVLVSQTGLNRLINELYRQNEGYNVHELINSERIQENEIFYTAEFSNLQNRMLNLDMILGNQSLKQIRA